MSSKVCGLTEQAVDWTASQKIGEIPREYNKILQESSLDYLMIKITCKTYKAKKVLLQQHGQFSR